MRRPLIAVFAALVVGAASGGIIATAADTDPCDALYDSTLAGEHAYAKCRLDRIEYGTQPTTSPTPTASPTTASPTPTPSELTTATVTNITTTSFTLNWTGTGASGYLVGRDGVDSKGTGAWSTTDPATARSRVFGNLLPGTSYKPYVEPVGGTRVTVTAKTAATATTTPTASSTSQPPATGAPNGPAGTWTAAFTDDFNGTSVDRSKWNDAYCKTMNKVTIDPANTSVANGIATLRLANGKGAMLTTASTDGCGGTTTNYTLPVGGFAEARVNFGTTTDGHCANWPAWWASGPAWPAAGEHDIAEVLTGQLTVNYHSPSGAHNQGAISGTWCGGWHVYGLHRKASSADVYWDGKLVKSYPTDDNGAGETLILNIGTSGSYPDTTKTMQVDYVRAWKP